MTPETLMAVLGWCAVINAGLLLWWLLFFIFAHDWMLRMHGRWFEIGRARFDAIHYAGMAMFKIAIIVFNLVPYLALRLVT